MHTAIKKTIGQYPVIVQGDIAGGYWVTCPALDGCYSQGETIEEALENIKEAIILCIEDNEGKTMSHKTQSVSIHLVTI